MSCGFQQLDYKLVHVAKQQYGWRVLAEIILQCNL